MADGVFQVSDLHESGGKFPFKKSKYPSFILQILRFSACFTAIRGRLLDVRAMLDDNDTQQYQI